jgi:tryptophan synthase alpha chain
VDIIELGIPFLDPAGDGPIIEDASKRAIKNGMNLVKTLEMVAQFRMDNNKTPIVLMGYYNPILRYGLEKFTQDAKKSGVDGVLVVDLPVEEDEILRGFAEKNHLDLIKLITLTSNEERIKKIINNAGGFLYLVSILGITGTKSADIGNNKIHIEKIKKYTNLPTVIGFGIKTQEQAQEMSKIGADGIVVGSKFVQIIEKSLEEGLEEKKMVDLVVNEVQNLSKVTKLK